MSYRTTALCFSAAILLTAACTDISPPVAPEDEPTATRVPHEKQQVAQWFRTVAPSVMALPHTVFAAHDKSRNVLVFGVENELARSRMQAELRQRGVPARAFRVQLAPPIHFMSDLRSEHRPTLGGLQIQSNRGTCTLGFNVDHGAGRSFITNTHCTEDRGETGGTEFHQPLQSDASSLIGVEADDPPYFRGGACSPGRLCRYSDAARIAYVADVASNRGEIARTGGTNNHDLEVAGNFSVTAQDNNTTSFERNEILHKVGRTTGWTSGTVSSSCVTANVANTRIQLLCQTMVSRLPAVAQEIVRPGDSGSSVFRLNGGNEVQLVGILWGADGAGSTFVFSPLKNIQDELGPLVATVHGEPPPADPGEPEDPEDPEDPDDPGDPGEPLQAGFTYACGNRSICQFSDTSSGDPSDWSWSFAGGNPAAATTQHASTTYESPGTYGVSLMVSRRDETAVAEQTITCRLQGPNLRCR